MSSVYPGLVLEGYEFIESIGESELCSVYRVRSLQSDSILVAKCIHVTDDNLDRAWQAFDGEFHALMRLRHPNIIKLYGRVRFSDTFILFLEYLSGGTLHDHIKRNGPIRGSGLVRMVKEIGSALNYAWAQGVNHRDIRPGNIMFSQSGLAKLVDFGLSVTIRREEDKAEVVGYGRSRICAAPEVLEGRPHDPMRSDIWAIGVTILWAAKGSVPWHCTSAQGLASMVQQKQYVIPENMKRGIVSLVKKMLVVIPENRVFPNDEALVALHMKPLLFRPQIQASSEIQSCMSFKNLSANTQSFAGRRRVSLISARGVPHVARSVAKLPVSKKRPIPGRASMRRQDWAAFREDGGDETQKRETTEEGQTAQKDLFLEGKADLGGETVVLGGDKLCRT